MEVFTYKLLFGTYETVIHWLNQRMDHLFKYEDI